MDTSSNKQHGAPKRQVSPSRELQERADIITRELQDALIPIQEEIDQLKKIGRYR